MGSLVWLLWQLKSSHRLTTLTCIMGKIEKCIYCQSIADIWTEVIEMFLKTFSIGHTFLVSSLFLFGCLGNQNAKK